MTSFNNAQQEQLKEIGAYLRQVRQEKSIRIEQLTAQTLIRQAFLEALEEGRHEELPEPIFVQGFIRRYGDALGLDGTALAKNFAISFFLLDSGEQHQNLKQKSSSLRIPLAVPYALLLAAASFALFSRLNPQQNSRESVAQNQSQLSTSPKKPLEQKTLSTPDAPIASLPETSSPAPTASPVEVTIELQEKSWLRVKADGKTEFEGELNKGERKTWTASKQLSILSGNAGAVIVSANNQQPKPLGGLGSVKQVTFTPQTVNSQ